MAATKPSKLSGPWDEGFSLDRHPTSSVYIGDDSYGHPRYETTYSEVGELMLCLVEIVDVWHRIPVLSCQASAWPAAARLPS